MFVNYPWSFMLFPVVILTSVVVSFTSSSDVDLSCLIFFSCFVCSDLWLGNGSVLGWAPTLTYLSRYFSLFILLLILFASCMILSWYFRISLGPMDLDYFDGDNSYFTWMFTCFKSASFDNRSSFRWLFFIFSIGKSTFWASAALYGLSLALILITSLINVLKFDLELE